MVLFALVFWTLATIRPWQADWRHDPDELNHPVAQLAQQLVAAGYDGKGLIVGSDNMVAAMLRSRNPHAYAMSCTAEWGRMAECLAGGRARAAAARGELRRGGPCARLLHRPILRLIDSARTVIAFREDTHYQLVMVLAVARRVLLELGRRLVDRGGLALDDR